MTRVLILGANGQLARHTTGVFLRTTQAALTLYLRRPSRLQNPDPKRVRIVEGDVLDTVALTAAMKDQDVVYANLAGDMKPQADAIIKAMHASGLKRLIFISSMGIYGEVPGERYRGVLDPYRDSAATIEASDLDYTILRPGWFTQEPGVACHITQKGEPFRGHDVSMDALSALIVKLCTTPGLQVRQSLGVSSG
jgi:uncharacterized protein YbjT (DUF2867 family)